MPTKKKYNSRFPPARIKKIMQSDEEVGKVAAAVPVIISRALELFVETLLKKVNDVTTNRGARTVTTSHLKLCIHSEDRFDFLKELVNSVPDLEGDRDDSPTTPNPSSSVPSTSTLTANNHHVSGSGGGSSSGSSSSICRPTRAKQKHRRTRKASIDGKIYPKPKLSKLEEVLTSSASSSTMSRSSSLVLDTQDSSSSNDVFIEETDSDPPPLSGDEGGGGGGGGEENGSSKQIQTIAPVIPFTLTIPPGGTATVEPGNAVNTPTPVAEVKILTPPLTLPNNRHGSSTNGNGTETTTTTTSGFSVSRLMENKNDLIVPGSAKNAGEDDDDDDDEDYDA